MLFYINSKQVKVYFSDVFANQMLAIQIPTNLKKFSNCPSDSTRIPKNSKTVHQGSDPNPTIRSSTMVSFIF